MKKLTRTTRLGSQRRTPVICDSDASVFSEQVR
jgi:hypothetical protein